MAFQTWLNEQQGNAAQVIAAKVNWGRQQAQRAFEVLTDQSAAAGFETADSDRETVLVASAAASVAGKVVRFAAGGVGFEGDTTALVIAAQTLADGRTALLVLRQRPSTVLVEKPLNLAELDQLLRNRVLQDARRLREVALTPGKEAIYPQKKAEVLAAKTTLAGVYPTLVGMTAAQKVTFRFSYASAKRRGETTIGAAIARFEAGEAASNSELARIESIVEVGLAAISAATTAAAKWAAFSAINWAWQTA